MNIHGSIAGLQNAGTRFYLAIAQCFKENFLIRNIWIEMARDKEQQFTSLKSLPPQFWSELKKREGALLEALETGLPRPVCPEDGEHSLQQCFTRTMEFEEPIILRVYAPIIRQLRTEWTDHALDFYIMIKAHVARLLRVVQLFCGDPALAQRASTLLQKFEKEVQTLAPQQPVIENRRTNKAVARIHSKESRMPSRRKTSSRRFGTAAKSRPIPSGKHSQHITSRSKALVKGIELPKRRARR